MTRAELKSMAKEQIRGNVWKLLLMSIVIYAVSFALFFLPLIGPIISFIITPAFSVSLCAVYLKLSKSEKTSIGDVFSQFDNTGRALWLSVLITIFTFLWSILLIIPGIIKSYSYSMAYYVLADNPELTAREALRKSKEIMNGHKFELFILLLSFFFWHILGYITFGLAYIYIIPYINATTTNFYNSIKE